MIIIIIVSQKLWIGEKKNTKNAMEYFPFNPTFQTSEEVRKKKMSPDEIYLDKIDENEQRLILQAIESSKSMSSEKESSPPKVSKKSSEDSKTPSVKNLPLLKKNVKSKTESLGEFLGGNPLNDPEGKA